MTSQVIFNLDTKLKNQAMRKASKDGLPFSAILKSATKAYIEGRLEVGVYEPPKFNEKTRRKLDKALKEIEQGKGLSPLITNAKELKAYFDSI
jgi:hypothetical protein